MSALSRRLPCIFVCILILSVSHSQRDTCSGDDCGGQSVFSSPGTAQFCIQNIGRGNTKILETLPGYGFDNLRNLDMAEVFDFSYGMCKATGDGQYLIPDNVFVTPQHSTSQSKFSEVIYDWNGYKSLTSLSINDDINKKTINLGFLSISGSYSKENVRVKTLQIRNNAATTRVQFRRPLYKVHLSSGMPLHPEFKRRVYEIASNYESGQADLADYYADLLIREYGTHFLTSVEVGGVIAKNDYIDLNFLSRSDIKNVTATAGFDFGFNIFGVNFDFGFQNVRVNLESMYAEYSRYRYASDVMSIGGPPLTDALNFSDWINGVDNNLGIIDREGEPLSFAITPDRFPEVSDRVLRNVAEIVQNSSDMYYKDNTRRGCTNISMTAFNPQANYPNKQDCKNGTDPISYLDVAFGGTYQSCYSTGRNSRLCGELMLSSENTITGGYTCPTGYSDVTLYRGSVSRTSSYTTTEESCILFFFCSDETVYRTDISTATYELHWCAALNIPFENRGKLFGGYYSALTYNPFTAGRSCPSFYQPSSFGKDVKICTSSDHELGGPDAIKFGGVFSCSVGNPLVDGPNVTTDVSKWTRTCPSGYSQHLIIVESGCEINICLETGSYNSKDTLDLLPPSLPPYRIPQYNYNGTEPIAVPGFRNTVLLKGYDGQWRSYNYSDPVVTATIAELKAAFTPNDEAQSSTAPAPTPDTASMKNSGHSLSTTVVIATTTWLILFLYI